jgi:hypothetical protein
MIKFLDLQKINAQYADELKQATAEVIDSGWYLLGERVKSFEQNLAKYIGVKNAIGVANGLDALRLILKAYIELGVMQEGDEIIVPANTYIATILAITDNRLVPVLAEPDLSTYNLDLSRFLISNFQFSISNSEFRFQNSDFRINNCKNPRHPPRPPLRTGMLERRIGRICEET